nr:hypothetical protein [Tanacetum cinerariifolium]
MVVVRFHCPFVGLNGCHDGSGNGLTKTSLITHLRDRHCNGDAQAITRQSLSTNLAVFEKAEVTFKSMGIWLCGVCFKTRSLCSKCRHNIGFVSPPDCGDGVVSIECKSGTKRQRHEESITNAIRSWGNPCGSLQLVKETLAGPSPSWSNIDEENLGVGERNAKHTLKPVPSLPHTPIDYHQLTASPAVVLDMIKSFPRGTSCGWDGLRAQHLMDYLSGAVMAISVELISSITQVFNLFLDGKCPKMLGEYIASAPLTPLVKPEGWYPSYCCGEAILHAVNRLIEDRGDVMGLSMLVDFKNAFNLVDREVMLHEIRIRCLAISRWVKFCYSTPARLYHGEHTLRSYQGVQQGDPFGPFLFSLVLHPLVSKIRDFYKLSLQAWYLDDGTIVGDTLVVREVLKEDPRSRFAGVFPSNIARPLHGVKLLGWPANANFDFSYELVMKRVSKSIVLMDTIAKLNDPQCELLLQHACAGISKLYFAMRVCSPRVFEQSHRSFDAALRSSLERIVTASGPGFGDW